MESKFDERQLYARLKGYRIGFFVMTALIFFFSIAQDSELMRYFESMSVVFSIILVIPIMIVINYFILTDAYDRSVGTMALSSLVFIILGVIEATNLTRLENYHIYVDGKWTDNLFSVLIMTAYLSFGITSGVRSFINRNK